MLSEGIHSLVDTGNQVLLLFGMRQARKPPDEQFPFGHGKEIYFWGFVVAILIFGIGATVSVYEGIHHLMHPRRIESFLVNYIVLASALSRSSRFFLEAFLLRRYGPTMQIFIERNLGWLSFLFVLLLFGGFLLLRH